MRLTDSKDFLKAQKCVLSPFRWTLKFKSTVSRQGGQKVQVASTVDAGTSRGPDPIDSKSKQPTPGYLGI
jgi:hypothetical protein